MPVDSGDYTYPIGGETMPEGQTESGGRAFWNALKPAGAGWLNLLMVRRREHRGDLVGTIAWWGFIAMLFCLVFGGSEFNTGSLHIEVPVLDIAEVIGFLSPIIAHSVKGALGK